jgi:acyl dehydratase
MGNFPKDEGHAKLTDEMIEGMRAAIGIKTPGVRNPWNTQANYDSIKQYAWGIGDPNPLWLDEEYAAATTHRGIIAPPSWLYSCTTGPLGPGSSPSRNAGLPGIHGLYVGDSWEFYDHVRLGDKVLSERYLDSVEELESNYAGRTIRVVNATRFFRSDGSSLGIARSEIRKHERGASTKKRGKYADIEPWVYSDEELGRIAAQYESERPRGGDPIDWQTVVVGSEIPVRLKGPVTSTSIITFLMGWGSPFCMTDRIAHEYIRLHPRANVPDSRTRAPDLPERAHWDETLWREIGFPLGYDIGPARISWFSHLLTDWIGDSGRIETYKVDLREPNWLGDITWLHGRIVEAQIIDGEPKVKLELWGESQRGRVHSRGEAQIVLGNVTNT